MKTDDFYVIESDAARNMMRVRFEALFWDLSIVDRFVADIFTTALQLPAPTETLTLVDLSNAILQSADVIARLQDVMANHTTGRIALIAANALARMQTKRLQVRPDIRLFASFAEAEAWLFSDADADMASRAA